MTFTKGELMADDRLMNLLAESIGEHLTKIESYFAQKVKITLLVRNEEEPSGSRDALFSNDNLDTVIEAIRLRKREGQTGSI